MPKLNAKKSFHALRKIYLAAQKLQKYGKGIEPQSGDYGFYWDEPKPFSDLSKEEPKKWVFEISCRIKGQSLWDGHIEEYHLHDVIGAQYKNDDEQENYRWLQWETRVPKSLHEYYIDELLVWASDIID